MKITSRHPHPLELQLYTFRDAEDGTKRPMKDGPAVTVHPGENEVDGEFWSKWKAQNGRSPLRQAIVE